MRRLALLSLSLFFFIFCFGILLPSSLQAKENEVKILFTHDMHSYLESSPTIIDGIKRDHGGAARLKTLIEANKDKYSLLVDSGDFSMGTLFQTGFTTDAYELRSLGLLGYDVVTLGNHEFDYGGKGLAAMLNAALSTGENLPRLVQANLNFDGDLTEEQKTLKKVFDSYGAAPYTIYTVNGINVAVFGLLGIDAIECAPHSGMNFDDYIESAKATVAEIGDKADIIICLSHSGYDANGEGGEDVELGESVPEIDLIVSGHQHTTAKEPYLVGNTVIVAAGEYAAYLGSITLQLQADGTVIPLNYDLLPVDENVADNAEMATMVNAFKEDVKANYLRSYDLGFDEVLAKTDFDFPSIRQLNDEHCENTLGNLIADSYFYAAKEAGVDDVDVAVVPLGTIRDTFLTGDITTDDIFRVCSLGQGSDGSVGHPLVTLYATGAEIKLLAELDASMGPLMPSIKMNYAGLSYSFNTKRMIFDKVTDIALVREDGSREIPEDEKLYKIICNIYSLDMLGMLNGLTYGVLSITAKDINGTPIEDSADCILKDKNGTEVKEWVALKDYVTSFDKEDGVALIDAKYKETDGRKISYSETGLARWESPGLTTLLVLILPLVFIAVIVLLIATRNRRKQRRAARKERRANKKDESKTQ